VIILEKPGKTRDTSRINLFRKKGTDLFLSLSVDKRGNSRRGMAFNPLIATTGTVGRQFQTCGWNSEKNCEAGGIS